MTVSDAYLAYVLEQSGDIGAVEARRMFGGARIYCRGVMFALVADDVLYLKVDDSNRADYEAAGAAPFRPYPDRPGQATVMSYDEVPAEVLEARASLAAWAQKAWRVAIRKNK